MEKLFPFAFMLLFVGCIGGMIAQQIFYSRLRKLHTATWEKLGKPVIILNAGMLGSIQFIKFLWRREYESLPDKKTVSFGRFLRAYLICYASLFALIILTLALTAKRHR
jgi:hypothetical protein